MAAPSSFASITNVQHLEELYAKWQADPASVDRDWQTFFTGFDLGFARPAPTTNDVSSAAAAPNDTPGRVEQQRADGLIYAYRDIGHLTCNLDPLDLANTPDHPNLKLEAYGLSESDLDREFACDSIYGMGKRATLRAIVTHLKATYGSTIAVEYQHIQDRNVRHWVRREVDGVGKETQRHQGQKRSC